MEEKAWQSRGGRGCRGKVAPIEWRNVHRGIFCEEKAYTLTLVPGSVER